MHSAANRSTGFSHHVVSGAIPTRLCMRNFSEWSSRKGRGVRGTNQKATTDGGFVGQKFLLSRGFSPHAGQRKPTCPTAEVGLRRHGGMPDADIPIALLSLLPCDQGQHKVASRLLMVARQVRLMASRRGQAATALQGLRGLCLTGPLRNAGHGERHDDKELCRREKEKRGGLGVAVQIFTLRTIPGTRARAV